MPFPMSWMTRRQALKGAAILAALATIRPKLAPADRSVDPSGETAMLAQGLLRIFRDPAAAAGIGRAYLQTRPEEIHRERLLALLLAEYPSTADQPAAGGQNASDTGSSRPARDRGTGDRTATAAVPEMRKMHTWLRRQTRSDFAAGRTVWVEGVLLARTEARLYALAAVV